MKKTITICDKCGKEIAEGKAVTIMDEIDICPKCWPKAQEAIRKWLCQASEEMKPKSIGQKTANLDIGKMQALRDAGWTIDRIAEEMGCDKAFVKEHTNTPGKKRKYPLEFTENEPILDPLIRGTQEAKPGKEVAE